MTGTRLRKPVGRRADGRIVVRRGIVLGPADGDPAQWLVLWIRHGRPLVVVESVQDAARWACDTDG